jgi:hypothetical protein
MRLGELSAQLLEWKLSQWAWMYSDLQVIEFLSGFIKESDIPPLVEQYRMIKELLQNEE